jgi:hypothetical protein
MDAMDGDRASVYAAELAAFEGTDLEQLRPFDELAELARTVVAGEWWPGPRVRFQRARVDARSSSTRCAEFDGATVRLARRQMTVATVAHELAHALAGSSAGHDDVFRIAYADVIAVVTNIVSTDRRRGLHVGQLLDAFAAADLAVGVRRWPAPPSAASGAIAL